MQVSSPLLACHLSEVPVTRSAMRLYRAFATVGGLTMVSRILGFVRDILIAAGLGTGAVADAFVVAFRLPNLFRRLFGEGAFNSAFVPLFSKKLEGEGQDAARSFAADAMAGLLLVLLVFTALAEIAMPWLVTVIAPGFVSDGAKFDLTVLLTRIAFPYLLCLSLVALLSGVLNSLGRFTAAAAAPILLNIILIAALLIAFALGLQTSPQAAIILCWGVAIAGAAQLAMLVWAARRAGMGIGLVRPRLTPDVRRLVSLGVPGLISGGITQINIVVGTMIASLQAGAASYLYYADRVYQLPLGIVGVAIGVVLLPDIARKLRAGADKEVMDSQNRALEFALFLTLPAAVALAVIAAPIIRVLYERGAFSPEATDATAWALAAFAWGLPAFVLQKVFQPAYFAREDTKTPMRFATVNLLVNAAGSIVLFFLFRWIGLSPHIGIALATTIAGWVNAVLLWVTLVQRGHFAADAPLRRRVPMIVAASLAMGAVVWWLSGVLEPWFAKPQASPVRFGALMGLVTCGMLTYAALIHATGAVDLRAVMRRVRR
jgi:putative peptidoglycan lipid II flippase